jgi:hypothetical protein
VGPTTATTTAAATAAVGHGQEEAGAVISGHAESHPGEKFAGVFTVADWTRGRDIGQGHRSFFFKNSFTL